MGKLVAWLVAVFLVTGIASASVAVSTPPRLTSFNAAMTPGRQELSLSWHLDATAGTANTIHLDLYQVNQGVAVRVGSTIIGRTVEPDTYSMPVPAGTWAVHATPENAAGFGPTLASSFITVGNPCVNGDLCVGVTKTVTGRVTDSGQGFLHALPGANDPTRPLVTSLRPKQWRFAGPDADAAARSFGVSRTQVLSDLWAQATYPRNGGAAFTPWSDWNRWDSFVRGTVRAAQAGGWAPNFWDVWNEPNGTCCPRFAPSDMASVTVAHWLDTYEHAWRAIKSVDSSAQIVGPSLSALQWAPGSPTEFDLDTFLAFSAARGLVWDAITWHENTIAPSPGDIASSVTNIDRHIAMARAVMQRHPGTVVGNRIFVNEYGAANVHMLAGWTVGYFRAFEDGGVNQANRACWDDAECTTGLDGLLATNGQPTAVWWAHRLYADLNGATRMTVTSTAPWQLDGLATSDSATRTVRVLLGRHFSCNKPVNAWCAWNPNVTPASVALTIDWPYGACPVQVSMSRLPAGTTALASPISFGTLVVRPQAGKIIAQIPTMNDGDAISLTLR